MRPEMLDDQHLMFRDSFRKFVLQEISPQHEQWEQDRVVSRDVWRKAGEAGFLCMDIPQAYGGMGEMVDIGYAKPGDRPMPTIARWLRLHEGIRHRQSLCGRARSTDLWRHQ